MTVWRIRIACWIPKSTNTHSEFVIIFAFPRQQWLNEGSSVLHYDCLVYKYSYSSISLIVLFNRMAFVTNSVEVEEFHLDLHTGRPPTQSDYTRSCIHTIVLLRMSTGLFETCRGFK